MDFHLSKAKEKKVRRKVSGVQIVSIFECQAEKWTSLKIWG
jgi:hypothetical protein